MEGWYRVLKDMVRIKMAILVISCAAKTLYN